MRIALRTSGGRGEYEISGSHANIGVSDVIDCRIDFEVLPGCTIKTNNIIRRVQGKTRIRLQKETTYTVKHIYLILADALLLPKPIRDIGVAPGGKLQLYENNFSIISIPFDVIKKNKEKLLISIVNIILSNSDNQTARLDIIERMRIVLDVWNASQNHKDNLAKYVRQHKEAFYSGNENKLAEAGKLIRAALGEQQDPLKLLADKLLPPEYGQTNPASYWMGLNLGEPESFTEFMVDENPANIQESMQSFIRQWRLQVQRGPDANRFSRNIKKIYNNTCLFTGYYLPKIDLTTMAGVESAHILPWAEYNLNSEINGLCLSRLCHWAFDCGMLRLSFNSVNGSYQLSIPEPFLSAERESKIDLTPFRTLEGTIPQNRLPEDRKRWPGPDHLIEYNKIIDAGF